MRVVNASGGQVVDTWAFSRADSAEHLSMEHTRTHLERLVPRPGDDLVSNRRRALVRVEEDTSPGVHDTLVAACDPARYRRLGHRGPHASCAENLRTALGLHGVVVADVPSPLNLFMHVAWSPDGTLRWLPSPAAAGDAVTLRALVPVLIVLSACPMDLNGINAAGPRGVLAEVISAPDPGAPEPLGRRGRGGP